MAGLLINGVTFFVLFSIIHFGCWWEYGKMISKITGEKLDRFIVYYFTTVGYILFLIIGLQNVFFDFGQIVFGYYLSYKTIFYILIFVGLLVFLFQNKSIGHYSKLFLFAGLVYISISLALVINLRTIGLWNLDSDLIDFGKIIPLAIFFSIWINDTMAYIVGSFIGKTPFSKISPKKTWEGTIGGAILCVITITLLGFFLPQTKHISIQHWIFISAICAIFGTLGDLLESKLKRMANIKDSGSFMPGHGGFLDRFDSLLVATPFVWLYVMLFM